MMAGSSGKVALIAGITGQDGAYLARFLLGKGYVVHGTSRDAALARLDGLIALGICDKVALHSMSPADFQSVAQVIEAVAPDEIYNLSGQSSVSLSFTQPAATLAGQIRRYWGWAPHYVEAMWQMLQCDQPDDFVVASGAAHSIEEFVSTAFAEVGLNWRDRVDYDSSLVRPSDIMCSFGDPTKAAHLLDWRPTVKLPEIVARMMRAEQEGPAAV